MDGEAQEESVDEAPTRLQLPEPTDEEEPEQHGEPDDEEKLELLLKAQEASSNEYRCWHRARRAILFAAFLAYVGASVGIPLAKASGVSCANGFFWEDCAHIRLFSVSAQDHVADAPSSGSLPFSFIHLGRCFCFPP